MSDQRRDAVELVTVVIPAWNEEADIAGCIEAVASQDHPLAAIQLIVVDAGSDDRTVEEARRAGERHPFKEVLVLDSPARRTSVALNVGLRAARGTYLARVDARSRIPSGYVRTCTGVLASRPGVGVVGGAQVARARSDRRVDAGIAQALRNRWATGMSRYRRSTVSGPGDTVWMGVFRTEELRALDGWSEAVALNEDYDLNGRYRARGRTVWFDAGLRSDYLPRPSLPALARQYFRFGRVKGTWWARGRRPVPRQVALVAAPVVLGGALAAACRRLGPAPAAALPLALLALERAGRVDRGGERSSPVVATTAIGVISGSWWVGVVAGFVGELVGMEHEHG